jgi:hypothetical protein
MCMYVITMLTAYIVASIVPHLCALHFIMPSHFEHTQYSIVCILCCCSCAHHKHPVLLHIRMPNHTTGYYSFTELYERGLLTKPEISEMRQFGEHS